MTQVLTVTGWAVVVYVAACVTANILTNWRPRMALRPARPRWEDSKEPAPDINVLASGKRLEILPPEYRTPGGTADRNWRTQEIRTEQKRAEF